MTPQGRRLNLTPAGNRKPCKSLGEDGTALLVLGPKEEIAMHSLIYIVGLIVVIVFVLSLLGLA